MQRLRRMLAILLGMCLLAGLPGFAIAQPASPRTLAAVVSFAAGNAQVAGRPAVRDMPVHEGDALLTGADGYLYLKTVDAGFLVLRPASQARIVTYRIDPDNPANSRVKLELTAGVARSVTGKAARAARDNFRFNTPVAAIGVRGTDFTVFTNAEVTRITVSAGGIIASGFGAGCSVDGGGPCEGPHSAELFAGQHGQVLQVLKNELAPQRLPANGNAPDRVAPPRRDEVATSPHAAIDPAMRTLASLELAAPSGTRPPPQREIIWGRWQPALNQSATLDIGQILAAGAELLAINPEFAIARTAGAEWRRPAENILGFSLTASEALLREDATGRLAPARLAGGQLEVDFARARFFTRFDLISTSNESFAMQARGDIAADGRLLGDSQFASPTNMAVSGALGPAGGATAGYLFQGRIDAGRVASGVTGWTRN